MIELVTRAKNGIEVYQGATMDSLQKQSILSDTIAKQCRFNSYDGSRLAYSLNDQVVVLDTATSPSSSVNGGYREVCRVSVPACADFVLSPKGTFLATFEKPVTSGQQQHFNMSIWRVSEAKKVASFCQKTQSMWIPQWTGDETYYGRMVSGEVQFFRSSNNITSNSNNSTSGEETKAAFRIKLDNLGGFAISPDRYPKVAVFQRESKGMPAAVRVFLLPNTTTPVAQKMFYKADRCQMQWSPSGKHLLALSQTEVDTTGVSYYGENNLYFISGDGSFDCRVPLDREGPIHDFAWSPQSSEFIVIYGYMPPKTVLFNLKCEEVFEFAVGSKNHIRYNAQGSLICFGGFGNLQGHIEIWHRPGLRRLGHFQAQSSSICEWSPDGVHLLTATVTPRLRVDNGFKVWTLQGRLLTEVSYGELYGCGWRPMSGDALPTITLDLDALSLSDASSSSGGLSSTGQSTEAVKKQVYRPPGLRRKLEESNSANSATSVGVKSDHTNKLSSANTANSAKKGSTADTKAAANTTTTPNTTTATKPVSKEERLVKKLAERLDQIGQLKLRMASGEALELNQIEKVEREAETVKEYEKAVIALRQSSSVKK